MEHIPDVTGRYPYEWGGPPQYYFDGPRIIPRYEYYEDTDKRPDALKIYDAVWTNTEINPQERERDIVMMDLFHTPLVRRSMGIEQLTLDPRYSTIPNTGYFSRFEHIWGSLVFARNMIESSPELSKLSEREKLVLELRTFVSDLGHTAFSHLGDWIFQGRGGDEDAHDLELMLIAEAGGVSEVLRKHGIEPEEVVFPDIEDWIECPSPKLCVDRVDYGAREAQRWMFNGVARTNLFAQDEAYKIVDNQLVMKSKRAAEEFFRAFSLLPTEHWQEPVHRVQLYLLEQMVKRVLATGGTSMSQMYHAYHPRDMLYMIDTDFISEFKTTDEFLWTVDPLMEAIGRAQRTIFAQQRQSQLGGYFESNSFRWQFPVPGSPTEYGARSWRSLDNPHVMIIPVESSDEIADFDQLDYSVDIFLPPLKARSINPNYVDSKGKVKNLYEADHRYAELAQRQKEIMAQAYVARVLVHPTYKELITRGIGENEKGFEANLQAPRMNTETMKHMLSNIWMIERTNPFVSFDYHRS